MGVFGDGSGQEREMPRVRMEVLGVQGGLFALSLVT